MGHNEQDEDLNIEINSDKKIKLETDIDKIKYYEGRNWNPVKIFIFAMTVIISLLFGFVKDSMHVSSYSGMPRCYPIQYIALGLVTLVMILVQFYSFRLVTFEQKVKEAHGFSYPHEIKFTIGKTLCLTFFGFIIGFFANILGLGGGFVIFPMLVFIKVSPLVASACTMFLIFVSKIVAATFAILGEYFLPGFTILTVVLVLLSVMFFIKIIDTLLKK